MTQIFTEDGATVQVTVVQAGPCVVMARRTAENDGYEAVQLGLIEAKPPRKVTKAQQGHFKKAGATPVRKLAEFEIEEGESWTAGDQVKVSMFQEQEYVDVVGTGKGKGFQGVMKRHNFRGGRASHGSMFHRAPVSIGGSSFPSRV
ncbi:MAG: 50S ribosomal protein L3, partial [Thermoanaerobaculia bacterium]